MKRLFRNLMTGVEAAKCRPKLIAPATFLPTRRRFAILAGNDRFLCRTRHRLSLGKATNVCELPGAVLKHDPNHALASDLAKQ
ncbi:MAG TPA: hypothetical protein VNN22_15470 [Verrucomicrobiae bacterium]|nr:hypothetical protein [Verrucomicrobiae bacterium]